VAESLGDLKEALAEKYEEEKRSTISKIVDDLEKQKIREGILTKGKRPDGRRPDEIRPIEIEVGILPRTHGSAMFKRGNTQALTVTTLGSPSLEQMIESMTGEESKRYMHHYNMPPYSVGETGRFGWPSRREVGHGALAERALEPVIPSEEKFAYAIRLVSEIMSSNGSTSMAAVCGSTLSLMDAGVPIKLPVAGIAMGMVSDGKKQVILSDILGVEDFNGDMDFKVAGTKNGITALQMDVKALDLTYELLAKALQQAREGRLYILEKMLKVLPGFRAQVSKFAPKVKMVRIPVEKIGEVIGPGGRMIRKIIEETGADIDVEDDGSVNISAPNKEAVDKAVGWVEGLIKEVEVGEVFEEGVVRRIEPFGAFVEVAPNKDGLVHVSQMSTGFVKDPADVVKIGQKVKVRVSKIDDMGKISLSMLFGEDAKARPDRPVRSGQSARYSGRRPRPDRQRRQSFSRHRR
jgi:polyribonucleotide nucleotidyltransferase